PDQSSGGNDLRKVIQYRPTTPEFLSWRQLCCGRGASRSGVDARWAFVRSDAADGSAASDCARRIDCSDAVVRPAVLNSGNSQSCAGEAYRLVVVWRI